jgi:hypothetical protein
LTTKRDPLDTTLSQFVRRAITVCVLLMGVCASKAPRRENDARQDTEAASPVNPFRQTPGQEQPEYVEPQRLENAFVLFFCGFVFSVLFTGMRSSLGPNAIVCGRHTQ